jgi:hypothetical protein
VLRTVVPDIQEVAMIQNRSTSRITIAFAAALLGCLTMGSANADCSNGIWCSGVIEAMTVADDLVYIKIVGGTTGLTNCTPVSTGYFTLYRSNVNFNSYYAMLVAAYIAKESVTLRPVDSSPNCVISYIAVP